jgi:uncharacterized protein
MKCALTATAALLLTIATASTGNAASFDCRKATKADEFAICDSRQLSELDVKMATIYDIVTKLVPMGTRGAIEDEQRAWLAARQACGPDRGCIRNLYDARIKTLMAQINRIASGGPY